MKKLKLAIMLMMVAEVAVQAENWKLVESKTYGFRWKSGSYTVFIIADSDENIRSAAINDSQQSSEFEEDLEQDDLPDWVWEAFSFVINTKEKFITSQLGKNQSLYICTSYRGWKYGVIFTPDGEEPEYYKCRRE